MPAAALAIARHAAPASNASGWAILTGLAALLVVWLYRRWRS